MVGLRFPYLRLSLTRRCGLGCMYCKGDSRTESAGGELTVPQLAEAVGFLCHRAGVEKVRLTGGEPLERDDLLECVRSLRRIPQIREICMTTNGQDLAGAAPLLKEAGLDRVNVSLDSLQEDTFRRITRGRLADTLDGIHTARAVGLAPLKINVVVMRGVNDAEIVDFVRFAMEIDVEVRFIELMKAGAALRWHKERFFPAAALLAVLRDHFFVEERPQTDYGPARIFTSQCRRGAATIGVIAPVTRPFCHSCRRLRLDSHGMLYTCLMNPRRLPLVEMLESQGSGLPAQTALQAFLSNKRPPVNASRGALVGIGG